MTATLRFTLDAARSAVVRPDLSMIFAGRSIDHFAQDVPVHDPEPLAADEIEVWEPTGLSLEEWPHEELVPKKRPPAIAEGYLPVLTDYRRPWPW